MTGHSFHTLAPVPQPSTTHPPEIVEWHPGPQPFAAAAGMKLERITANKIANVLMRCSSQNPLYPPNLSQRLLKGRINLFHSLGLECVYPMILKPPLAS